MSDEKKLKWYELGQQAENRRTARINWDLVRHTYIFAEPEFDNERTTVRYITLAEVGEKFDIHPAMVYVKAAKEGWADRRRAYRQKVKDLHDREMDILSIRKSAMFDADNIKRLELFSKLFDEWLRDHAPDVALSQSEKDAYIQLCMDENINPQTGRALASDENSAQRSVNGVISDEDGVDDGLRHVNYDVSSEVDYGEYEEPRSKASIKDLNMAIDVMSKMHKLNRDIMGEPVNYEQFYADKAKEARMLAEKGKVVSKSDIRDLIATIRGETSSDNGATNGVSITLDVDVDELKDVSEVENDE